MERQFWHDRWDQNQIGFHEAAPNALMQRHVSVLDLMPGARVFLPLCGKTRDIGWLRAQGFRVVGAELSEVAIRQLFDELGETPVITEDGAVTRFATDALDVWVGDIFDVTRAQLGPVDAVYDRAALVALPPGMRDDYVAHMTALTVAPRLLICFSYDQTLMSGPPFSIDAAEVARLFADRWTAKELETVTVPGGLKGRAPATETVWHITPAAP